MDCTKMRKKIPSDQVGQKYALWLLTQSYWCRQLSDISLSVHSGYASKGTKLSSKISHEISHIWLRTAISLQSALINNTLRNWVQLSSLQSLDRLDRRVDMRDDSAEILFQSFLHEALVNRSGMGRDIHCLMLSSQHFLCRPRRRPLSKVPPGIVFERLSWCVTCPNHARFCLQTIARKGSCGPTRKLILLCTQSLVLCSK